MQCNYTACEYTPQHIPHPPVQPLIPLRQGSTPHFLFPLLLFSALLQHHLLSSSKLSFLTLLPVSPYLHLERKELLLAVKLNIHSFVWGLNKTVEFIIKKKRYSPIFII